ncbi:TPA: hypothetical protein I8608_001543 [Morganella morganii]|uniref:Uncharacterized protein n=1 Tax=Morganella morganii TaxID=582 RepID=A0AAN5MEU3_MORMO|nr:hypothetical protein [Morganella morganii]
MYSSASNSISVDAIPVSRQDNHCPAISGKIDLLKEKLNAIEPNKTTHEIRYFTDFIEKNETKMRDITAISDKLLTALSVMNSIKDNIAMGEDNKANLIQLNNLTREMEDMLKPDERKNVGERVAAEVSRSAEKVAKEAQRAAERVTNEAERSADKVKNEFHRVKKKWKL